VPERGGATQYIVMGTREGAQDGPMEGQGVPEGWESPLVQEVLEGPRGPGRAHGVWEGPRGVLKCQRRSKKLQEDSLHCTPMSATIGLLSKVMLRPPSLIYHSSGWEFGITKYQIFMEAGTLFLYLISGGHGGPNTFQKMKN
jgi:hypothetical protein